MKDRIAEVLIEISADEDEKISEELIILLIEEMQEELKDYNRDLDEDDAQEIALVISEYVLNKDYLKGRVRKLSESNCDEIKEIAAEIAAESKKRCIKALDALATEDTNAHFAQDAVLIRVNDLNDAALQYEEEFGIKPTPKELAKYINKSVDYILDTVQMSGYLIDSIDYDTSVK